MIAFEEEDVRMETLFYYYYRLSIFIKSMLSEIAIFKKNLIDTYNCIFFSLTSK